MPWTTKTAGGVYQISYVFYSSLPSFYNNRIVTDGDLNPIIDAASNSTHFFDDAGLFQPIAVREENIVRKALNSGVASFANVAFTPSTLPAANLSYGILDFSSNGRGAFASLGRGSGTYIDGNIWLLDETTVHSATARVQGSSHPGDYTYWSIPHETGHALGLQHSSYVDPVTGIRLPNGGFSTVEDSQKYTIMSYNVHAAEGSAVYDYQLYDIASLQYLYGRNKNLNNGTSTYDTFDAVNPGDGTVQDRIFSIWDGGGNDTIDASGYTGKSAYIDLRPGHFSSIGPDAFGDNSEISDNFTIKLGNNNTLGRENISIAFGTYIENAVGSDVNDVIIGNMFSNNIQGGGGNDMLFGDGFGIQIADDGLVALGRSVTGLNADLPGGTRDAEYGLIRKGAISVGSIPGAATVRDSVNGEGGDDLIVGSNGADNLSGGDGNDLLFGGANIDTLDGGAGNDRLYGGAGADNLHGGAGDDYIDGGYGLDTVSYSAGLDGFIADHGINIDITKFIPDPTRPNIARALVQVRDDGYGGTDTLINISRIVGTEHSDTISVQYLGTAASAATQPAAKMVLDLGSAVDGPGDTLDFSLLPQSVIVDLRPITQ